MSSRVGFGYDVHRLKEGEDLWLGGIKINHHKGAEGHSDADVLLHVICDALLGGANLRDIGFHFPDTDPAYRNIDSKELLQRTMSLVREKGYEVENIDTTIALQKPKIGGYIEDMKKCIAEVMDVDVDQISIKATTTEKLGFIGREEGIAAYAVALIYSR